MRVFCLVALALGPAPALVRADEPAGPRPSLAPELAWVPSTCTAFVHVRFAELWDSPVGKAFRDAFAKSDPKALVEIEQRLGVRLAQIDSITAVIPEVGERDPFGSLVVRVNTTEPYDVKRVLASLEAEDSEGEGKASPNRKIFHLRDRGLLHLSGAKSLTFVLHRDGAAGMLGRLLEPKSEGGISPALLEASRKNQIVAALDVSQLAHLKSDAVPESFRPLFDGKLAVVRGNLNGAAAELSLRLSFGRPGLARDGAEAVEALRREMLVALERGVKELSADADGAGRVKVVQAIAAMVKAAKVETKDSEVIAAANVETTEPLRILATEGIAAVKLSSARMESSNNLKQIGLAMHNYHDTMQMLPPAAICDKNGKPLLSWRVLVLPYIEQDNLYRQFKLDEPWDSEHNKKLIQHMPKTYLLPGDKVKHELPSSYYRVFVGNEAMFSLRKGTSFAEITDGLSNTLMVIESESAVPWTKPEELEYDPKKEPKLGAHFGGANALLGDGSVRLLPKSIKPEKLHLLIQRNDGMPIMID